MEAIGYVGALLMGVVLGVMGGGGAVLTVPILAYLFKIDVVTATGYSLFVVGLTSLIGAIEPMRSGKIHVKTAMLFAIPSMATTFLVRKFALPNLPETLMSIGGVSVGKNVMLMLLFATTMFVSALVMIRSNKISREHQEMRPARLMTQGLFVGTLAGLIGAGGGFLIIPALVLLAGLEMKQAVGASLLIIAIQSLVGFSGEVSAQTDWRFLILFSMLASAGILIGGKISSRIPNEKLKPAFGWFILAMSIAILGREVPTLFANF